MSSIYFATTDKTVSISGSDRRFFSNMAASIFVGMVAPETFSIEQRSAFLDALGLEKNHYLRETSSPHFYSWAMTYLRLKGETKKIELYLMHLNTLIKMGVPCLKLGAKIDGTCELHGWFSPYSYRWLHKTINEGIELGFFRDKRWHDVAALIETTNSLMVMSYSVCDTFAAGALWDEAVNSLDPNLEIREENLSTPFGRGQDVFSFNQKIGCAEVL